MNARITVGNPPMRMLLAGGSVLRHSECFRWRGRVQEMERRTTLHLQRRAWIVGQDVRRGMERWVVAPPTAPVRVVLPARRAELTRAHDLRTDPGSVLVGHHMIDPLGAARLAEDFTAAEPGGEHPLVEPMPGVAERGVDNVMPSPVPKPSREIDELATRTWHMAASENLGD